MRNTHYRYIARSQKALLGPVILYNTAHTVFDDVEATLEGTWMFLIKY